MYCQACTEERLLTHSKPLPIAYAVGTEIVEFFKVADCGAVLCGNGRECFSTTHFMIIGTGIASPGIFFLGHYGAIFNRVHGDRFDAQRIFRVTENLLSMLYEIVHFAGRQAEGIGAILSGNIVGTVLGVEGTEFFDVYADIFADVGEGHVAFHHDGVSAEREGDPFGMKAVLRIEIHDVGGSDEGWHIATGFAGQVGIDLPEVLFATATGYCFVDVAWTTIVGSDGEVPVAKNAV